MRFLQFLMLSVFMLSPLPAFSADGGSDAPPPPAAKEAVSDPHVVPEAPKFDINPDAEKPSTADVIAGGKDAFDAGKNAVKGGGVLAWMAAVAAALWAIILVVRRWGGGLIGGNAVRMVTVFGGAAAALAGYFGAGLGWSEALQVFMAGPGALAFNEVVKLFGNPSKPPPAKEPA